MTAARPFWRWLLLLWAVTAMVAIALSWSSIAGFRMADPDDIMRLVEVRDWMGGQTWFDVSQHRMKPPSGLSMHWSRLLDVPLAAAIAIARLFTSQRAAETIAAVAIPMLTLGTVMVLVALLTRRWARPALALFAAGLCTTSVAVWYAMRPMRIDHHGWQITAGLAIALALTGRPTRRNAAIAGLCAALWTHISLEGLPFAVAAGAWLGFQAMIGERQEAPRLGAYLAALTIGAAVLLLAVKGPTAFLIPQCDAISTLHLAVFGCATVASVVAARLPQPIRIAVLLIGAAGAALFYRANIGVCGAGPFGLLGPLGQHLWYRSVLEGLPQWRLPPELAALWTPLPIVGLAGAILALAKTPERAARASLLTYVVLLGVAIGVGALVMRASGFANMLAMPGAMLALSAIARAAERFARPLRVLALTAAVIVCSPLGAGLACVIVDVAKPAPPSAPPSPAKSACDAIDDFAALDRLPPTIILTPIDIGPALIAGSHHRTITGPYHRDPQALEDVLRFFTLPPDGAHAVAVARHADYLAFCPGENDLAVMAKFAPRGVAAALRHGSLPWLERVALPGPLTVYRIIATASPSSR